VGFSPNGREATPKEERIWVAYDLITSERPTAEQALEQVLGFLEMQCG